MKLKSGFPYSLIRYGLPFSYPKLTENIKADVVILGGGISGALMAHALCDTGIECVVIDGRSIGLGSSSASTSLLQYEIDVPLQELIKLRGKEDAVRAYHLCRKAIYSLKDLCDKLGFSDFELNKSLYYSASKRDINFLKEEFRLRKENGFEVEWLDKKDISKHYGFTADAAILSKDGGHADAYLLTHILLQKCITSGLKVYDRSYVKTIKQNKDGVLLLTENGCKVEAKKLIYATGYEITEMISKKIVKLHSTYVTISENMTDNNPLLDKNTLIWNTADPYLYMRSTNDGRIIVGGRDENFVNPVKRDKLIDKKSKQLVKDFKSLFKDVPFEQEFSWSGTFGSTKDGLPYIGEYEKYPNSYFALGFGGNGITFSVIAAEIIRDMILGKNNEDTSLFTFDRS